MTPFLKEYIVLCDKYQKFIDYNEEFGFFIEDLEVETYQWQLVELEGNEP